MSDRPGPPTTQERRFLVAQRWLLLLGVASVGLGLVMTLAPASVFMRGYTDAVAPAFWGDAPVPDPARAQEAWLLKVLGTTIVGWAVMFTFVVAGPFRRREPWAWRAVLSSVLLWVCLDALVSARAGVSIEVLFSAGFLVVVAAPLALAWSAFPRRGEPRRG